MKNFFQKKHDRWKSKNKKMSDVERKKKKTVREEDERSSASERGTLIENFISPLFGVKATHGLSRKNAIAFDSHMA